MAKVYVIDFTEHPDMGITSANNDEYYTSLKEVRAEVKRLNKKEASGDGWSYRRLSIAKPRRSKITKVDFDSSNLKSGKYNRDTGTLRIEFTNGSVYIYGDVTPTEFGQLCSADSQGSYFSTAIKPSKKCKKVST